MKRNYKVLSTNIPNGTFVIEFEGKQPLNFWIPHDGASFLTGLELEDAIQSMYPEELDIPSKFISFNNASEIEALVEKPDVVEEEEKPAFDVTVRLQRNNLLGKSDWTQLPDAQLTTEQKEAWALYRQALRDITSQAGFPTTVDWPVAPQ